MGRMGEHIDRLHALYAVMAVEQGEIARLSGRIAADIDETRGSGPLDDLDDIGMHSRTRRIDNHDLRTAMGADKLIGKHIFHVAGKEQRLVGQPVDGGVNLSVADSFGHIFDSDDLSGRSGEETGDRSCSGVKVIDKLVPP